MSAQWTVPADPWATPAESFDDVCPPDLGDGRLAEQAATAVAELNARAAQARAERLGGAA